jgi:hypothetical protein
MRDQGSIDAAPATLRAEESQPGLDPNNPGAAPDTTLGTSVLLVWEGKPFVASGVPRNPLMLHRWGNDKRAGQNPVCRPTVPVQ